MLDTLNWAVLGTGVIANEMAQALQKIGKSLYAVGNRTHEKAVAFAEKYGVLLPDGPLAGLLARSVVVVDPEGKVVYTELVPEITQEPDYEAALKAVK